MHASGETPREERRLTGAALDITERREEETTRRRLEQQLAEAHRMDALGRLAGGIAHDFNNLLAAILPNAELLRLDMAKDDDARESVDAIMAATLRARDLVKQILGFARQRHDQDRVVDLAGVVEEVLRMMRAGLPRSLDLKANLPPGTTVLGDSSQLHQVVANLVTNAVQAMGEAGGRLEIELRAVPMDGAEAIAQGIEPGLYVRLDVKDTGHGIEPDVIGRIFDPFFTTKGAGGGTGLGLSVVHTVVRSYGGVIRVESEAGKGSRFSVYLPAASMTDRSKIATDRPDVEVRNRTGRILLVDDEAGVLRTTCRILERRGYSVVAVGSGPAALAELSQDGAPFDLLLTDLTMPEMSGVSLAREARELRPSLPIVVMTGYGAALERNEAASLGIHHILAKPVTSDVLAATLAEALEERPRAVKVSQPAPEGSRPV